MRNTPQNPFWIDQTNAEQIIRTPAPDAPQVSQKSPTDRNRSLRYLSVSKNTKMHIIGFGSPGHVRNPQIMKLRSFRILP